MRRIVKSLLAIFKLLLAILLLIIGAEIVLSQSPGSYESSEFDFQAAVNLATEVNRLGERLLETLADEKLPIKTRLLAANGLGYIRFLPAIPKLIELIDLHDPEYFFDEMSIVDAYPCVAALERYGLAAVPHIVEAYMDESDERTLILLRVVIRRSKTRDHGIVYARGLAAVKSINKEKVEEFVLGMQPKR